MAEKIGFRLVTLESFHDHKSCHSGRRVDHKSVSKRQSTTCVQSTLKKVDEFYLAAEHGESQRRQKIEGSQRTAKLAIGCKKMRCAQGSE